MQKQSKGNKSMIKPKEHFHGSDLEKIEAHYGINKEKITNFAGNVNPLGISPQLKHSLAEQIDKIQEYPDREYTNLRKCIASYVGTNFERILVGNGSTELISLLIHEIGAKKACILGPTYSEYEREIQLNGGESFYYFLKESDDFNLDLDSFINFLKDDFDLLVLCNPNNPTSTGFSTNEISVILEQCRKQNIFCLIDETYIEFVENLNATSAVTLTNNYDNCMILRGISKFFAAPGLRLGYGICSNTTLLTGIYEKKNPWTINTLAAIAGEIMFQDQTYITATKKHIQTERTYVYERLLTCNKLKLYPPTANFILVQILDQNITADDVFEVCIKKGLMIRNCSTFPKLSNQYFRFCFMSSEKNRELLDLILELFNQ